MPGNVSNPPRPAGTVRSSDALRIFFLLPTLSPYGGVISVVNLLNLLVDMGHPVTLASMSPSNSPLLYPRTEPILFDGGGGPSGLHRLFDVLVATSWQTVEPIDAMSKATRTPAVYFVQDFEPDFYQPGDPRAEAARATYQQIDTRIVKTRYLQERLRAEGGWESHLVPPGMDLDVFYPRISPEERKPSVIAMARPNPPAEHRGFDILQEVYRQLSRERPLVGLMSFGSSNPPFSAKVEAHGRVPPESLPPLYSRAAVYVDVSRRHGFGRTGAEAMACGTAAVLTDSGGISEYAVDRVNSLVIPTEDPDAAVNAVVHLLDDIETRVQLARAGRETVSQFSDALAAEAFVRVIGSCLNG